MKDVEETFVKTSSRFMGAVILKQEPKATDGAVGDVRVVIDGQQRLTSLTLFFKAISVLDPSARTPFIRRFLLEDDSLSLQHNFVDTPAFEAALRADGPVTEYPNSATTQAYN